MRTAATCQDNNAPQQQSVTCRPRPRPRRAWRGRRRGGRRAPPSSRAVVLLLGRVVVVVWSCCGGGVVVDALRRLRALCCCCALLLWTCARKTWRQMLQHETYIRGVTRPASSHDRWSARICLASAGRIAAGSTSSSMPLRHTAGGIDSIAALDHEPIHSMSQRV